MLTPIPQDLVLRGARALCRRADVELVEPGDLRRLAVLYALAAVHAISGTGWDLEHAREHVSVTLPGAGGAVDLLRAIPLVGALFAKACEGLRRPAIYLAPSAMLDGVTLLGVVQHELGHVGSIRAGGLAWCLAYGIVPEVRAGAEAPCYGTSIAHAVLLGGADLDAELARARAALDAYGLDAAAMDLAEHELASVRASLAAGADPGGTVAETRAVLRSLGWQG